MRPYADRLCDPDVLTVETTDPGDRRDMAIVCAGR